MKLKAFKIICTFMIASVLSIEIIALPVHNAFAKENTQIEMSDSNGISLLSASSSSGTWIQASNGKWWYKHTDGTYTKNNWEYINGKWYFFDSDGWMKSSQWLLWKDNWYYLSSSGAMYTGGWLLYKEKWYYLKSSGIMHTGWLLYKHNWYYLNSDGSMRTSQLIEKKREYKFSSSGTLNSTRILVTRIQQKYDDCCWAACSLMVGTYNTNYTFSQDDIINKYSYLGKSGGSPLKISLAIKYVSGNTKEARCVPNLSYEEFINLIDSNHPFVLNMYFQSLGGHAMVGAGYRLNQRQIYIIDPSVSNETDYYFYDHVANSGAKIGSYTADCMNMVIY